MHHQIRNEQDLSRHLDFFHYNPVRHSLVTDPADWPWSTYHRYLRQGHYGQAPLLHRRGDLTDIDAGE